jgi:hypothetical protein
MIDLYVEQYIEKNAMTRGDTPDSAPRAGKYAPAPAAESALGRSGRAVPGLRTARTIWPGRLFA